MGKARKEYILDENGQRIRLPSGEWKSRKVRTTDWDDQGNLEKWRHAWEVLQNEYLEKAGRTERIDMRSYERQGVDLIPTIHMGPEATAMEKRGIRTYVGDMNREIKARNALLRAIKKKLDSIKEWLEERHERKAAAEAERNLLKNPVRQIIFLNLIPAHRQHMLANLKMGRIEKTDNFNQS